MKVTAVGDPPEGLKLARSEILPGTIRIKGPKNRVAQITSLSTVPVDISAIKETTIVPLSFDFKAMGIDPDSVLPEMNIEIQGHGSAFKIKHVPLKVKSTGKAVVDDEEVTVIVRTDPGETVKVDGEDVSAVVDVRDMPSGEYEKLIRVQLPERIHLVKVIPSSTRVVVKGQ